MHRDLAVPTSIVSATTEEGTINPLALERVIILLREGEVVALPTETVYGLAANADDGRAVNKIFAIKSRPIHHPLIIHLASSENIPHFADINSPRLRNRLERLIRTCTPGPLTMILPRRENRAEEASGGHPSIAVRLPSHPFFHAIAQSFNGLAAPSANLFGRVSPVCAQHVWDDLHGKLPLIVDGGVTDNGLESTIINLVADEPQIVRPGPIPREHLMQVLGEEVHELAVQQRSNIDAPGNLARHYAPNKLFWACAPKALQSRLIASHQARQRVGLMANRDTLDQMAQWPIQATITRTNADTAQEFSQHFYRHLRDLEGADIDEIGLVLPPDINKAEWRAVRDRLSKALGAPL